MSQEAQARMDALDPRVQAALDELRDTIQKHYPTARFAVSRGHDEPENVHLMTIVDLDDPDEVLDLVIDRVVNLQVEERIPVHVIPIRPVERVLQEMRARTPKRRPRTRRVVQLLGRSDLLGR